MGLPKALEEMEARGALEQAATDDLFETEGPSGLAQAVRDEGRRRGRPKGAQNRSTEEWRRFVIGTKGSPLEMLMDTASKETEALARELRLFRYVGGWPVYELTADGSWREQLAEDALLVAHKLQEQARVAALPYLHKKMPQAIENKDGAAVGLLVIGGASGPAQVERQGFGLPLASEENQSLIEGESVRLDAGKSDDD